MIKKILKKILGTLLIIVGFLALITPFTPGSWLLFVGLGLLGLRIGFEDKLPSFLRKRIGERISKRIGERIGEMNRGRPPKNN